LHQGFPFLIIYWKLSPNCITIIKIVYINAILHVNIWSTMEFPFHSSMTPLVRYNKHFTSKITETCSSEMQQYSNWTWLPQEGCLWYKYRQSAGSTSRLKWGLNECTDISFPIASIKIFISTNSFSLNVMGFSLYVLST
jgi:hypothetical protein